MATNDAAVAKRNIHFFIDAGLLQDSDCRIRDAIDRDQPVLPSLSGTAPPTPQGLHSPPEIATLYNFPNGFDGRGVMVGIIEFGGNIVVSDLKPYFESLKLPPPEVTSVFIDGGSLEKDASLDTQVMLDIEIIGAIAPRAGIRVYFAPFTSSSLVHAIERATADGVAVLSIGWGQEETNWKEEEIKKINSALEQTARQQITVVAPVGNGGAADGRRHADFPASSPWVLSVGGTSLKSKDGRITSETVWRPLWGSPAATGGGVSEKFDRPDWQTAVRATNRPDGKPGRATPDVVASADPALGVPILVHGTAAAIGGTSVSVPLWAGLIVLIDQALGYHVGHLNPLLYREIGPAGVFRAVAANDDKAAPGNADSTGPRWTPDAGWGSPDGAKLLDWLRAHPTSSDGSKVASIDCLSHSK
jgi:kumamolisin